MNPKILEKRLDRMRTAYDYVAANPGATRYEMVPALHRSMSSVRDVLRLLKEGGYVTVQYMPQIGLLHQPSRYFVTDKDMEEFEGVDTRDLCVDRNPIRRVIVPAFQIGIPRDPLVAALFGAGTAMQTMEVS